MTAQAAGQRKIGDEVEGWEMMAARQLSLYEYRVLSWRSGLSVYCVDLRDPSCTCPDQQYNRTDGEVCAHISKALYVAKPHLRLEDWALRDVNTLLNEMERAASEMAELVETATDSEAESMARQLDREERPDDERRVTRETDADHVKAVSLWLEECGVPTDKLQVWQAESGNIVVTPDDYLGDETFKAFVDALDHPAIIQIDGYEYEIPSGEVAGLVL